MALKGISSIARNISNNEVFLFCVIDDTHAGGLHQVCVIYDSSQNLAFIEVPNELEARVRGGTNPTILHTVEIIVSACKLASSGFPSLIFGLQQKDFFKYHKNKYLYAKKNKVVIPLNIDPKDTNALIFHTQMRHINPEKLVRSWYEFYKSDRHSIENPIRHTILVSPVSNSELIVNNFFSSDQPEKKSVINFMTLPKQFIEDRTRFKTFHLSRISRWEKFDLNQMFGLYAIINSEV